MNETTALFWINCVSIVLIDGFMLVFSKIFLQHPPKTINSLYGYRTTMSMKNGDTWTFAHQTIGLLAQKSGVPVLVGSLILLYALRFVPGYAATSMVVLFLQIGWIFVLLFLTERALHKRFDKDGNRLEGTDDFQ